MTPVDLRTSWYFSTPVRLAAAVLAISGLLIVLVNIYIGLALVISGVLAATTHYRLAIDFTKKTYRDYVWVLGIKSGDDGKFDSIQYVFINKTKVSQTMNSKVSSTTIVRDEYNGYLKFSERNKVHLASSENKQRLTIAMKLISQQFKCELLDYTEGSGTRI